MDDTEYDTEYERANEDILRAAAMPPREAVLREALALTTGDRHATYGDPYDNHAHIARIVNAVAGLNLSAADVVLVHIATKMARRQRSPLHRDSYVDGAAYDAIQYECALAEADRVIPPPPP